MIDIESKQVVADIAEAVRVMRAGGVILYPTDTVWGIGCDATNAEAVAKVYAIKKRTESKAMICLVDSDNRIQRYVRNIPEVAWDVMTMSEKPTTVILDGADGLAKNLIAEDGSIAVRITQEPFSKALCYRMQKPIVSSSGPQSHPPLNAGLRMSAWFFAHGTLLIGYARPIFARSSSALRTGLSKCAAMAFFPSLRKGLTSNV